MTAHGLRSATRPPASKASHTPERLAHAAIKATGSSPAFVIALLLVIAWLATGPIFQYSDSWQLVINTATTVVTFLMVFLIQRAQNKESLTIQLKLNEIVAAMEGASNRLIDAEDFSEHELEVLHQHYEELAKLARDEMDIRQSHSIDEAAKRHRRKRPSHAQATAGANGHGGEKNKIRT